MEKLNLRIKKGECWWGGDIALGGLRPVTGWAFASFDLDEITTENQVTSLFISNKGRFIWCDDGLKISAAFGWLVARSNKNNLIYQEGFGNLRNAFLHAEKLFFPPSGKHPATALFTRPQYSTWIALNTNQTQAGILNYAEGILKAGLPAGTLIIDNGWQQHFGEWVFNKDRFPDPDNMMEQLGRMGFEVMLWVSPFVSSKAADYETLKEDSMLIRNRYGEVSKTHRQKGSEAALDFSNPKTAVWFKAQIAKLSKRYPVMKGIKQDAGDPKYYKINDITYAKICPNTQARLWSEFAEEYEYNEMRAAVNRGGRPLLQRQMDKTHTWGNVYGLRSLIPCAMLQGIMGYPFLCADMVGGGQISNFKSALIRFINPELMLRYAEVSALMPAMQFSFPIWSLKRKNAAARVADAIRLHTEFAPYIVECVENAAKTGEPIVRIMEYDFPDDGLEKQKDQFMLGDRYLVAPVVKNHKRVKIVSLPAGLWRHVNNDQVYRGGQDIEVKAPLGNVPVFEKMD